MLKGLTIAQIAAAEGVCWATIQRDGQAIRGRWRVEVIDIDALREEQVAKIRQIDQLAAAEFEARPSPRWLDVRLRCAERLARLLGLDAPEQYQHIDDAPVVIEWVEPDGSRCSGTPPRPAGELGEGFD